MMIKNIIGLLRDVAFYKKMLSPVYREKYASNFKVENVTDAEKTLWNKRAPKIQKIDQKIDKSILKTQQVTPSFVDQLIGFYERKNTSQKDKMYILLELQKYYSPKIIQFFFKLNDTELNKQLRWIAFYHLQSFNYQPRARRQKYMQVHTKNKKRKKYLKEVYPNETYNIPKNPYELEYRIENAKEQKVKEFDFFISHSSKDSATVQKLILFENKQGVGEKRWKALILLSFLRAWLQIGCKNVLSICCQNDLNMYIGNAAEESAAFVVLHRNEKIC